MPTRKYFFIVLFFLVSIGVEAETLVWESSYETGMSKARQENQPAMILFYTDWCGWCRKLNAEVFPDPQVQGSAAGFVCIKVNCEKDQKTAEKYKINGFPTVVFASSRGEELSRIDGFADKATMISYLKGAQEKSLAHASSSNSSNQIQETLASHEDFQEQYRKAEQFYDLGLKMEKIGRKPQAVNFYSKTAELVPNTPLGINARNKIKALKSDEDLQVRQI